MEKQWYNIRMGYLILYLNASITTYYLCADFHVINGVLQTAFGIFEKYSIDMKSQKLWEEIKFVLDNFAAPFTKLLDDTMNLAKENC